MGDIGDRRSRASATAARTRATIVAGAVLAIAALAIAVMLWPAPPGDRSRHAASTTYTAGAHVDAPAVDGSEVQPPDDGAPPLDRIPPLEPAQPRVAELPASASARGGIVAGYPVEVAAPVATDDVLDSAVASGDGAVQFSLRARSDAPASEILEHYRALWTSLGLAATTAQGGGVSFRDAFSSITVVTEEGGTGVVYVIHGVLRTA